MSRHDGMTFDDYTALIAERLREGPGVVSEPPPDHGYRIATLPDERLAQCIWYDSMFLHEGLCLDDGRPLEILDSGNWNHESGPDFQGARLRIAGRRLEGDIEVHLEPGGWRQHRHHQDPAYDGVVLHAYLWPGAAGTEPARNSRGQALPGFCMQPHLFPDFETICQTVQVEDYPYRSPASLGRCHALMCGMEEEVVTGLLDSAGLERLEAKSRRLADQARGESLDQAFHQALCVAQGHKANKGLFFLLSKRAPLAELVDYLYDFNPRPDEEEAARFFEALLLNVAGLVPEGRETLDAETRNYLEGLDNCWQPFAPFFQDRLIPATRQWNTGVRPVNFAQRRIAALARLAARCFLGQGPVERFSTLTESFPSGAATREARRWIRHSLCGVFVVDAPGSYWAHRYNFTARRAARPMKLLGEARAASIALNALLPLLHAHARAARLRALEGRLREIYRHFPPLESNAVVRHMRHRLFGEHPRGERLIRGEQRQQALFHLFAHCCRQNDRSCEDCLYFQEHLARR